MGSSDSGGSGGGSYEIRYAPFLETELNAIISHTGADTPDKSLWDLYNALLGKSPYDDYEQLDIDEGFFGMTIENDEVTYEIKNFPSLWDMFGKFMAGLDLHDLWSDVYQDVVNGPEIENAVVAQSDLMQDEIDARVYPAFVAGMRDINAVQSTAFIIGKAVIQDAHVKAINKFSSDMRVAGLNASVAMWSKHLDWDQAVIGTYSELFKIYYATKMDMDRANVEYVAKDLMWDYNLLDEIRGIIGALNGAAASPIKNEPSQMSKAIGGGLAGAAAGYQMTGSPFGALTGGVLGVASSIF